MVRPNKYGVIGVVDGFCGVIGNHLGGVIVTLPVAFKREPSLREPTTIKENE